VLEDRIAADLARPEAYEPRPDAVEVLETHISRVFLAGDFAFKIKKPVDFGFLDFGTLEKRRFFCEEELRLNRRLSPDIYLGLEPITEGPDGRLRLGGDGEPVEFAVKMKRLPSDRLMTELFRRGEIEGADVDRITDVLADFFRQAEGGDRVRAYGRIETIRHYTDEDFWQTADFVGTALADYRYDHIKQYNDRFLEQNGPLFTARIGGGFIREGHGDLHAGNIFLGEKVWIFDCIEFNEAMRCHDAASDLAFLSMDLDFHGRPDLSGRLIDRYVDLSGDVGVYDVLDFYKCYRAYVRGKINCYAFDRPDAAPSERQEALRKAQRYFDLAYRYAAGTRRPRIIVFFGLMGSGKSHWSRAAGRMTGARVVSTDRVRKRLAGLGAESRVYVPFGRGIYADEMTRKVYDSVLDTAERLAGAGGDVILDGSYGRETHRRAVVEMAERVGASLTFVETKAPEEAIIRRLADREAGGRSVSDGRREIYHNQVESFEPPVNLSPARLVHLETSQSLEAAEQKLRTLLGLC
jgi:aminoglycoside phosphotransferase family enzyme/predicted kinase